MRINPDIDQNDIKRVYENVFLAPDNEDLGQAFYEMLTTTSCIKLIDFSSPENFVKNNSFNVVTELTYKNGEDEFRPDITLLINGMPLAFIEVKRSNNTQGILAEREHYLSNLHNKQNQEEFAKFFDDTLRDIAIFNNDIFSVKTGTGSKIVLFDEVNQFITDSSQRDNFCRALINQLINFSFEKIFKQKFDFFSTIFKYLVKDYNKDGGGIYAEYHTPHAVAKIMASILVDSPVSNVTCNDPSASSGTLLMSLAHAIGEDRCTLYSQDISQKLSSMLRLNLILNNLVHSIQNVIQGNTLLTPYHKIGDRLMTFDYIVSNPPFKLDFSDYHADLDTKQNHDRFFAGIPNISNKDKDKMLIYLLFIQHIIYSLSAKGKAAIVVPTGFITVQSGIEKKIRQKQIN